MRYKIHKKEICYGLWPFWYWNSFICFFLTIDVILYAFNAAIRTLSPNDIAESKEGKAKYREMISKILESPSRFNDTVNIIVYITNIIAGSYILGSLARRVIQSVNGDKTWVYIVLAVAMILVFIIFGVIIPEKCGRRKPVRTAIRLVKYVRFLMLVLSPVVFVTTMIAKGILRILALKILMLRKMLQRKKSLQWLMKVRSRAFWRPERLK